MTELERALARSCLVCRTTASALCQARGFDFAMLVALDRDEGKVPVPVCPAHEDELSAQLLKFEGFEKLRGPK